MDNLNKLLRNIDMLVIWDAMYSRYVTVLQPLVFSAFSHGWIKVWIYGIYIYIYIYMLDEAFGNGLQILRDEN